MRGTGLVVLGLLVAGATPVAAQGAGAGAEWKVPPAFAARGDRDAYRRAGGSAEGLAAIEKALAFLTAAQSKDGRWDADGWPAVVGVKADARDAGDARYDVGVTSLALLAFLADGQTPSKGKHQQAVASGFAWLLGQQKPDGSLGFGRAEEVYNHAGATLALVEGWALTGDAKLRQGAQAALDWCLKAQNPNLGWQYGVKPGRNDTSVTAWMLQALLIAEEAGMVVPAEAGLGGRRWLARVTDVRGNVGYQTPGGGSSFLPPNDGKFDELPAMTAAALAVQLRMGDKPEDLAKGLKILAREAPVWGAGPRTKVNFYYWYYGALALEQAGGEAWDAWSDALEKALLPNQVTEGKLAGSWPPAGEWCLAGGRIYGTAINALSLSVYTRYARQ